MCRYKRKNVKENIAKTNRNCDLKQSKNKDKIHYRKWKKHQLATLSNQTIFPSVYWTCNHDNPVNLYWENPFFLMDTLTTAWLSIDGAKMTNLKCIKGIKGHICYCHRLNRLRYGSCSFVRWKASADVLIEIDGWKLKKAQQLSLSWAKIT